MATSHDTARHGHHRADDNFLARGKDSETQIKSFYEFERRNELDGGAVVESPRNTAAPDAGLPSDKANLPITALRDRYPSSSSHS